MSIEHPMIDNEWINVPARLSKRPKGKRQYLHPEVVEHIDDESKNQRSSRLPWARMDVDQHSYYDGRSHRSCSMTVLPYISQ